MQFKKTILSAALAGFVTSGAGQAMAGGIPVIDVASITQQIIQVQHMVNQLRQLENQVRTAGEQLENARGVRGMAGILDTAYNTAIQIDNVAERQILEDAGLKDAQTIKIEDEAFQNVYNQRNQEAAQALGRSQNVVQQSQHRTEELKRLIDRINQAPEQKDIMDLTARINAESVMLQNEVLQLQAMQAEAEAQDRAYQQKIRQMAVESTGDNNFTISLIN